MKRTIFVLPVLTTVLGLMPVGQVMAQTLTTLHSFSARPVSYPYTNSDGAAPQGSLAISSNTLYGTAYYGGKFGYGTVFRLNTDGFGFTNLHDFDNDNDGAYLIGGLILSSNTLYGTAYSGGPSGFGTVFKVNTDGSGFAVLHNFIFNGHEGLYPEAGLVLAGNTLYGTTTGGGAGSEGAVFAVNTDGSGFTNLYSFTAPNNATNRDGANPQASLVLSSNTLYGTTHAGGFWGNGTVFRVNTDGLSFTNLHSFTATYNIANHDGAEPQAGLVLRSNTLYGTAYFGGDWANGTVFKLNTDGSDFLTLHSFSQEAQNYFGIYTNRDGANPVANLFLSGNTLYGTAPYGGSAPNGTVFSLNTDGSSFTTLHSFTDISGPYPGTNSDGINPGAGLILSSNILYGTTPGGGGSGYGTVFSLSLGSLNPPQLTLIASGASLILTWPTSAAGFTLQSAPAITGTFTNLPGATSPYTNPITGAQQFFRLIAN